MSDKIHIIVQEEAINLMVDAGGVGGNGAAIKASGSYMQNTGTIVFQTSPTVTFGLETNGVMTASVSPPSGGGGNWSTSTQLGSQIDISTATDINTLYYGNFLTAASGAGAALKGSGTYTQNSGTIEFANSNGITFGLTNNQMTGSYSQSTHEHPYINTSISTDFLTTAALSDHTHDQYVNTSVSSNFLTTAMASDAGSNFVGLGSTLTTTAGTDVAMTFNSEGLNLAIPAYITTYAAGGGQIDISAGGSSASLASVVFSDGSGVSFGLNGSTITASVKTDYQTSGNYLTTAALSDHTHDIYVNTSISSQWLTTALATDYTSHTHDNYVNTSVSSQWLTTALNTDYTSHTHSQYLTTALGTDYTSHTHDYAESDHTHDDYLNTSLSSQWLTTAMQSNYTSVFQYTSNTSLITSNALNTSQSSLFTAQSYQPVAISGSNTSTTASTISFGNSNGLSFYITNGSLVGSYSVPSGVSGSWELEGTNTAGTTGSEFQTLYLSGGQNVTLEGSSNTIIFNVNATGAQDGGNVLAVSGSTASSTGTVAFWNANNFTFGFSESTRITASFSQSTHAHPYINTSQSSLFEHISHTSAITASALNTSQSSLFQHTSVNSLSLGTEYSSHTHTYLGTQSNQAFSGSNGSSTFQTLSFGNSNSLSLYITNGSLVGSFSQSTHAHPYVLTADSTLLQHTSATSAITSNALNTSQSSLFQHTSDNSLSLGTVYTSHTHLYQSTGDYLTTAALSNHSHGNPTLALTNLSGTTASNSAGLTLSLSGPDVGGAQTGISGVGVSNTTYTSGTFIFSNQSNITIGSSVNGASQYVRLSVADAIPLANSTQYATSILDNTFLTTGYTTHTHEYLTTAALSNHSHGAGSLSLNGISGTYSSASNGWTLSLTNSTHEHPYINTSVSGSFQLTSDNSLSLGTGYTTHTHDYQSTNANYLTSQLGQAISGSNASSTFQTISFGNSNNHSFYLTNGSVVASFSESTHVHPYVNTSQSSLFEHTSHTSAITSNALNTSVSGSFQLTSDNSLSLGTAYTTHTHDYAATNHTHSDLYIALANSTDYATSVLDDTFLTTGYTTHTHNYIPLANSTQYATSVLSATFQTTGAYLTTAALSNHTHGNISIAGTNLTATTASASNGMTLSLSVADPGAAEEYNYITLYGNTSNASTASGSSILLSAGNNITLAASNGSIKIEGGAGGGGVAIADSVSTLSNNTLVLSDSNGIAWGLNGSTLTASYTVPAEGTLSFINTHGVSFISSSDGSTTSISASVETNYIPLANSTMYPQVWQLAGNTGGTSSGTAFYSSSALRLYAGNNITLSASSDNIISIIGGAGGGGVNIIASDATYTSGSVEFRGTNVTINTSAGGQYVDLSVAAPGDAAEHNYITLYGNTSNASTLSGSTINLYGGNNITLAVTGNSVQIEGGAGGGGVAIGAGTVTATSGTVIFSNSNSVSFGLDGATLTASIPQASLIFTNANGITFGTTVDGNTTTVGGSVNAGGGGTSIVPGDYLSSSLGGSTLSLSVTGLQATSATSAITVDAVNTSILTNLQYTSATSLITASAMNTSVSSLFAGVGETTAGAVSATMDTNGLNISVPAVGYLSLVNSAGYTWSTSVNGVSTAIWLVLA